MTLEALYLALVKTGIPTTYYQYDIGQEPKLPYLVYYERGRADLFADNKNYLKAKEMIVELYTEHKDLETENKLEQALTEEGIVYRVYEARIESEKLYQRVYEFSI